MKKFFRALFVIILLVVLAFYFLVVPYFVGMIKDYDRYTFDFVLSNPEMVADYGIGDKRDPGDYGFKFEEVSYKTVFDDLNLNGWWVPATKPGVEQTLIISHGRTSNRLKTMKYLALVKDHGLDTLYNVFIPDHRNSGKSEVASTALGYEFAEDIVAAMTMLKGRERQREFVLWGFSMGAMASAITVNRPDLVDYINRENIVVKKLILASPLSNAKETSWVAGQEMGIPKPIFDLAWKGFDKEVNGWSDQMKFSYLLSNNKTPALVLYGTGDLTTPYEILEAEIDGLFHVIPIMFADADHVQLYTQEKYKERYGTKVSEFLRIE
mgnify:CR=1 FL=1